VRGWKGAGAIFGLLHYFEERRYKLKRDFRQGDDKRTPHKRKQKAREEGGKMIIIIREIEIQQQQQKGRQDFVDDLSSMVKLGRATCMVYVLLVSK
jgi:hypothetical protein